MKSFLWLWLPASMALAQTPTYIDDTFKLKAAGLENPKQYLLDRFEYIQAKLFLLHEHVQRTGKPLYGFDSEGGNFCYSLNVYPHLANVSQAFMAIGTDLANKGWRLYHFNKLIQRGMKSDRIEAFFQSISGANGIQNFPKENVDIFRYENRVDISNQEDVIDYLLGRRFALELDHIGWVARSLSSLRLYERRIVLIYALENQENRFHCLMMGRNLSDRYIELEIPGIIERGQAMLRSEEHR